MKFIAKSLVAFTVGAVIGYTALTVHNIIKGLKAL